jgi:hypothetical protein
LYRPRFSERDEYFSFSELTSIFLVDTGRPLLIRSPGHAPEQGARYQLHARFAVELPLILSGPILRRVEPGLVSVWVALSKACAVQLSLFEGLAKAGDTPKFSRDADKVDTVAIGDKLHIAVVMMKLTGADVLKPGQAYSYNISLTEKTGGTKNDLNSLNLLKDNILSTTPVEKRRLALGYAESQLPSFALPPDKLTDLKIIHGSCRLQVAGLTDGLAWIDDLIKDNLSDPNQRIHQLLLAGDQIYAGRRRGHDAAADGCPWPGPVGEARIPGHQ